MYFKLLLNYIFGYVTIVIEGFFLERVLNIIKFKNIFVWNNKKINSSVITINIGIKDFKKVCRILKENKCKVKIKCKKGLPFIFNRYKKRKIFALLLIILLIFVVFISFFVWNIDIVGNTNISSDELLKIINDNGLKIGAFKGKINTKEIVDALRLYRNDLAWVGIEIKGTNAIVKIVEAQKKPEIINENEFCNIIATKDGIITKINAVNGTPLVKEGDVVKKGTVLIGGYIEGKYTNTRYVHANGEVYAKVWYVEKQKIDENVVILNKTGNEENRYSVKFNNFIINFYKTLSNFKNYDTIVSRKKIKLFSDFYLPIEIIKYTNYEQEESTKKYTLEEAKSKACEELQLILDKQIEGREENKLNTYIDFNEQTKEMTVIYEMQEVIGTKEKIEF